MHIGNTCNKVELQLNSQRIISRDLWRNFQHFYKGNGIWHQSEQGARTAVLNRILEVLDE